MVMLKKTEIKERKRGYESLINTFDTKLEKLQSDYTKTNEKLQNIIKHKKELIIKLEKEIIKLKSKGFTEEAEVLSLMKNSLEEEVTKYDNTKKELIIPSISKLFYSGELEEIKKYL
ncbi:hypothetical protein DXC27_10735 [Ruminococcus sp. OM08-7]|nr:hypothetical protein DXC27_10735 [Ruminococcus sp. OM08-7]